MQQHGWAGWTLVLLLLLCWQLQQASSAETATSVAVPCGPSKPGCVMLVVDGTAANLAPLFRQSLTNSSITEIVLAGDRYVLKPDSWSIFSQQQPYRLQRDVLVRGKGQGEWQVMDFNLIQKKVLIAAGVTLTFQDLVLANVRKLGGFGLDFFMGETGSAMVMNNTIRIKPACQPAQDVLKSAQSFARVSEEYPPNDVDLLDNFCFTAAVTGPDPQRQCYQDALYATHFSLLASYQDPDKGSQYPGYVLYMRNVTRVCTNTISQQCLQDTNGDEELCMAMLVASGPSSQLGKPKGGANYGASSWSHGAVAGVAVAGGMGLLIVVLLCILRRKLMRCCWRGTPRKTLPDDLEMGLRDDVDNHHLDLYHIPPSGFGKAISQQVTLTTLLGAGSFGRVYKGRFHSSDVAIKIITVRSPEELPRVLREAEVMMQLDHINIVRAFHASVWNPAEQARALESKLLGRDGRNNSSSSNVQPAAAAAAASDAAAADASAHAGQGGQGQQPGPSRLSDSRAQLAVPAAAAAAAVAAAPASVAGSDTAEQPRALRGQQQTGSTLGQPSDGGQLPARTGQHTGAAAAAPAGSSGAAAAADVVPAGTRASGSLFGWLPFGAAAPQPQQQNRTGLQSVGSSGADCASTMHGDLSSYDLSVGQRAGGATSTRGASSGAQSSAGTQQHSGVPDRVLDTTAMHTGAGVKASQGAQQGSPGAAANQQQSQQQQPQQQQAGGLPYRLLQGWRQRGSSSASSYGGGSAVLPEAVAHGSSPLAAPNAAAAAAQAGGGSAHGRRHSDGSLRSGGAAAAAAAAGVAAGGSTRGGAFALIAPDVRPASRGSSSCKQSGQHISQGSWGGSLGSDHEQEQDNKTPQSEQQVWIILELCTGGTLLDAALAGRFKAVPGDDEAENKTRLAKLLSHLLDAANGMAYLHSRGVLHGDLKAGNLLLQHSIHGSYGMVAKVSDFGLSTMLHNGSTHRSTASLGTITHASPELLRSGRLSPSSDVYSFGILMWEVYCGRQAWQGLHYGVVVERVIVKQERPPVPDDMPEEYVLLMQHCWDQDPTKRPAFPQIVECLEILLDNLGSDENAGGSEDGHSRGPAAAGASAASGPSHVVVNLPEQQQQEQQQNQLDWQQPGQPQEQVLLPAAAAAAAAAQHEAHGEVQVVANGHHPAALMQPWQPPALPIEQVQHPAAAAALQAAGIAAGVPAAAAHALAQVPAPSASDVTPPTPLQHSHQSVKRGSALFDSGLTPSGGLLCVTEVSPPPAASSQPHSGSSNLRSTSSHAGHSSQHVTSSSTARLLPSVLDHSVFLQDL